MNIKEVKGRNKLLIEQLLTVWESSVKATHLFLSESEIEEIKQYVPIALNKVVHLIIAENEKELPVAFMGVEEEKIEMLFILPSERGKGLGKKLLNYGIENFAATELCVNEQNTQAKEFYEYMSFQVYKRTDYNEQGNPYPLLYMKLR